jgi:serine/threonine-protein kinase
VGVHEIVGVLGMSAANEVLLATTRGPHGFARQVVVKRVRDPDPHDESATRALVREALAYARLNHPTVVQLYEVLEEAGRLAIILEYVPGASLTRVRNLLGRTGDALDDACALHVMTNVFSALAAAHEARDPWTGEFVPVVHRDVNPNNVLLSWDGLVKLTDFGIAKITGVESDTRVGLLKGTYGYMAPEQVLGEPITPRTDVYCACLMLRELLLGRRNFDPRGKHELELMQEMASPAFEPIERLRPGVPPVIAGALRIGLEADPDARAMTAAEMRDVLAAYVRAAEAREQLSRKLATMRAVAGNAAPQEQAATTGQHDAPVPSPRPSPRSTLPTLDETPWAVTSLECPSSGVRSPSVDSPAPPSAAPSPFARSVPPAPPLLPPPSTVPVPPPLAPPPPRPPPLPVLAPIEHPLLARSPLHVETPQAMVQNVSPPVKEPSTTTPARLVMAIAASLVLAVGAAATWTSLHRPPRAELARTSTPVAPAAPAVSTVRPATGASPLPAVASSAPVSPDPTHGTLVTPDLADSHRVYVDDRVVGTSGSALQVRCGPHVVRIGSKGRPQKVSVPCGGRVAISPMW